MRALVGLGASIACSFTATSRAGDCRELAPGRSFEAVRVRDDASFASERGLEPGDLVLVDAHVDGYGGAGTAAPTGRSRRRGTRSAASFSRAA